MKMKVGQLNVTQMSGGDRTLWSEMRAALWPEETAQQHSAAIEVMLQAGEAWGFVAQDEDGAALGFAEVAIRKYANGCDSMPVPFLEGIWVAPRFRRRGVGAQLIRFVEAFVQERGFHELGSDTQIDNLELQAAHQAWGFSETERVVYFRKLLGK